MLFNGVRWKLTDTKKKQVDYKVSNIDELFKKIKKEGFRLLGTGDHGDLSFVKETRDDLEFINIIEVKEA